MKTQVRFYVPDLDNVFFLTLDNWICFFFVFHLTLFFQSVKIYAASFWFSSPKPVVLGPKAGRHFHTSYKFGSMDINIRKDVADTRVLAPPLVAASVRIGSGASEKFQVFEKSLFFDVFFAHYMSTLWAMKQNPWLFRVYYRGLLYYPLLWEL